MFEEDIDMLFSTTEITADFENYGISIPEEKEILLDKGKYIEKGSVVKFAGRKSSGNSHLSDINKPP